MNCKWSLKKHLWQLLEASTLLGSLLFLWDNKFQKRAHILSLDFVYQRPQLLITVFVMMGAVCASLDDVHLKCSSKHLTPNLCNSIITWTHLIAHLQREPLSSGLEVLCVGVHCEVNLLVKALYVNRVPVLIIKQTAHSHCSRAAAEPWPAVICKKKRTKKQVDKETTRILLALFIPPLRLWS